MFHECKLVHADLSEYNILYHESQLCIIDVGQSVEHDHPSSFDFLRADLKNVEDFFGRRGTPTLGIRRSFEFIIGEASNEQLARDWLDKLLLEVQTSSETKDTEFDTEQVHSDDKVFMQSYIPRTLNAVYDPERDVDIIKEGKGSSLIYSDVIGIVGMPESIGIASREPEEEGSDETSEADGTVEKEGSDSEAETFEKKGPRGHRNEDKEVKKVRIRMLYTHTDGETNNFMFQLRKQIVKEAAREKRKQKMPKAEKKWRIKATRS